MKIGHLTFGTPEYVRVTKMAEREEVEKAAIKAWDEWYTMIENDPTPAERETRCIRFLKKSKVYCIRKELNADEFRN